MLKNAKNKINWQMYKKILIMQLNHAIIAFLLFKMSQTFCAQIPCPHLYRTLFHVLDIIEIHIIYWKI